MAATTAAFPQSHVHDQAAPRATKRAKLSLASDTLLCDYFGVQDALFRKEQEVLAAKANCDEADVKNAFKSMRKRVNALSKASLQHVPEFHAPAEDHPAAAVALPTALPSTIDNTYGAAAAAEQQQPDDPEVLDGQEAERVAAGILKKISEVQAAARASLVALLNPSGSSVRDGVGFCRFLASEPPVSVRLEALAVLEAAADDIEWLETAEDIGLQPARTLDGWLTAGVREQHVSLLVRTMRALAKTQNGALAGRLARPRLRRLTEHSSPHVQAAAKELLKVHDMKVASGVKDDRGMWPPPDNLTAKAVDNYATYPLDRAPQYAQLSGRLEGEATLEDVAQKQLQEQRRCLAMAPPPRMPFFPVDLHEFEDQNEHMLASGVTLPAYVQPMPFRQQF